MNRLTQVASWSAFCQLSGLGHYVLVCALVAISMSIGFWAITQLINVGKDN